MNTMTPEMFLSAGSVVAAAASVVAVVVKVVVENRAKSTGGDKARNAYRSHVEDLKAKRKPRYEELIKKAYTTGSVGFESREYSFLPSDIFKNNIGDVLVTMDDGSRIVFQGKIATEENVRKVVEAIEP